MEQKKNTDKTREIWKFYLRLPAKKEVYALDMCRYALLPHIIKRRIITNLETNNNQNCQKNQTVWKSDTQGDKEQTFIQTGRRGRDRQPGQRGLTAGQWVEDQGRRSGS